jgi:hypothetical protein
MKRWVLSYSFCAHTWKKVVRFSPHLDPKRECACTHNSLRRAPQPGSGASRSWLVLDRARRFRHTCRERETHLPSPTLRKRWRISPPTSPVLLSSRESRPCTRQSPRPRTPLHAAAVAAATVVPCSTKLVVRQSEKWPQSEILGIESSAHLLLPNEDSSYCAATNHEKSKNNRIQMKKKAREESGRTVA